MTATDYERLRQEVAAAPTVEDAVAILATVSPLDLTEDQIAELIDVSRDK